ncbi:MAG: CDGSH iron-sulfur domain-containing protein [Planctomycetes bacterium]|nr:CDGSH iron-sulfur domain-containing protein [Planctomycetota bacterium]MCB9871788.1 CDGSH iron-sulfur domain-containing protein [Planctomycetota bacterium]
MDQPHCPQKLPYVVEVEPGTYAWCSCGRSAKQPYCDGSHGGTGFLPLIEKIAERKKVAWCGCKRTAGKPYCDGSHSRI